MGYVPGFEWDIFLSYPMEAEAWARQFEKHLKADLALAAKNVKIHRAQRDWQAGKISDDMLDAARRSAIFVAVLTRDALDDDDDKERFLQREMAAFRQASKKSGRSLKGRFCPIFLQPIDEAKLSRAMPLDNPDSFWNMNAKFYFDDEGAPILLTPEMQPVQYKVIVSKVAHHLRYRLDELIPKTRRAFAVTGAFSGMTVFLAQIEPNSQVQTDWEDIRALLINDGATVVPNETANDVAAIESANLFVQLFSAVDGMDVAKAQFKLVKGSKVPILQWRKKLSDPKKDSAILNSLDGEDKELCDGENVHTGLLSEFKETVRDKLEELAKPPPPIVDRRPYLYITADTTDLAFARQLQAAARTRIVTEIMIQDESQRRNDFEEGLKHASAVVFLYGNTKRPFVDFWLKEFVRKIQPFKPDSKFTALYLAPPEKGEEDEPLVPFDGLRKEGSYKEFTLQGIENICSELLR
jgi:hypothetical protein